MIQIKSYYHGRVRERLVGIHQISEEVNIECLRMCVLLPITILVLKARSNAIIVETVWGIKYFT